MSGDDQDAMLSTRDRVLVLAIPCLLVLVGVAQILISTTTDLTPWRGGGFGMFSTLDSQSTRHVHAEVLVGGEWLPVALDRVIQVDEVRRAYISHRAWPRQHTLDRLARRLRDADLVVVDGNATRAEDAALINDARPVPNAEIYVEVWTSRFDRSSRQLDRLLLNHGSSRP